MALTQQSIDRSYYIARQLFMDAHFIPRLTEEGHPRYTAIDSDRATAILDILSDSGMIYIAVWDNASALWADIRQYDDYGVGNWILQASVNWRCMSFESQELYLEYIQHLSECYSGFHPKPVKGVMVEKNIAVDDDLHNRLPEQGEHYALLYTNPWLVFLLTLHMSYYDLTKELYQSNPELIARFQREQANA